MSRPSSRLTAIDALRGAIMVIMALDHTRDFFHAGAMTFSPEDLARTTPFLFFTRWITHICAPVFLFTAGVGAFLRSQRPGTTTAQLSRFLWTRGLWLVIVELTVMRLAMNFSFATRYPVLLLVLWALGWSMIALAALVHLPRRVLAIASIAVIVLHNAFDGVQAAQFGAFSGLWNVLHQPGVFFLGGVAVRRRLSAGAVGGGDGGWLLRRSAPAAPAAGAAARASRVGHRARRRVRGSARGRTSTAIRSRGPRSRHRYSPRSRSCGRRSIRRRSRFC